MHLQVNTDMFWAAVRSFDVMHQQMNSEYIFISHAAYTENELLHSSVNWSISPLLNKTNEICLYYVYL